MLVREKVQNIQHLMRWKSVKLRVLAFCACKCAEPSILNVEKFSESAAGNMCFT